MITYSCCRRVYGKRYEDVIDDTDYNTIDKIHHNKPFLHYISRSNLFQFFAEDKNYERLKKILDLKNGILEKTIKLIDNDQSINMDYHNTQQLYGRNYFNHTYNIPSIFEIRDADFKTSIAQLNYIRWFIINDYFLYIE